MTDHKSKQIDTSKNYGPDKTMKAFVESMSEDCCQHHNIIKDTSKYIYQSCCKIHSNNKIYEKDVGLNEGPILSYDQSYKPDIMSEEIKGMSVTVKGHQCRLDRKFSNEYKMTTLLKISHCLLNLEKNQTPLDEVFIREKKPANNNYLDFGKLGKSFYHVLTGRGLSEDAYRHLESGNNKEVGQLLSEEDCDDSFTAQDLIEQIISEEDFTIKKVLQHPFFWSKWEKINFICQAYESLVPEYKRTKKVVKKYENDENKDVIIPKEGWIEELKLSETEIRKINSKNQKETTIRIDAIYECTFNNSKRKFFDKHSIFDLLRYFRNHHIHYWEKDDIIRTAFGSYNEGYWDFFYRRFPKLLIHVYRTMRNNFGRDFFTENVDFRRKNMRVKRNENLKLQQHKEIDEKGDSLGEILNTPSQDVKLIGLPHVSSRQSHAMIETEGESDVDSGEEQRIVSLSTPETQDRSTTPKKKIVIQECDYGETMERIIKTVDEIEEILIYHDCIISEFEISGCDLQKEHFEVLLQKIGTLVEAADKKLTIRKLSIETTKNVKETILACCEIVRLCSTTSISFQFNNLKCKDIKLLFDNLPENVELRELDVSYNKNISSEGFSHVGSIVQQHGVKSLIAIDCNISDVELQSLISGIKVAKLDFLDISSSKLSPAGFGYLGEFVADKRVKSLKLSGFQLTQKKLEAYFAKTTNSIQESDGDPTLLEELDVSYNSKMEPEAYETLGMVVKTCGIKNLNLAGCSLSKTRLRNLHNGIKKYQMTALNARDNSSIGEEGIAEIAEIMKGASFGELDISECQFAAQELKIFRKALGGARLKCLILGDSRRRHDREYITEVCELFPYVIKRLQLISGSCNDVCRSRLLKKLNSLTESELKVKLNDDFTLSRCKDILADEKVSSAAELGIILPCSSEITPVARGVSRNLKRGESKNSMLDKALAAKAQKFC